MSDEGDSDDPWPEDDDITPSLPVEPQPFQPPRMLELTPDGITEVYELLESIRAESPANAQDVARIKLILFGYRSGAA